ncbi:Glucose-repressible alcohol dehydrogenase transcriptional effector [Friedmanniomyces endolithicus]|uniref:CCR4-Not complex 3'-5'-exoribonuclease subunit Ccr4 n=1 Tax=Friedmanniomyces endolithicus TaxID=329885 RepID=A0AAN6FIA1_9PEZI|nr:Glucose-repressible alcohol dehydrogenase transcriptional effector [Friedmanniomyces endolithicus]KAK0293504.1 Glucose-repressible alcohol dehydrogenase transcriptional effector [Friedmanniomyces endolithicus]KAK0318920.1 Glucose-repressible alcohol dehydrogenase transcriptional effector [Friedmanniomyces endolithicus]KAK0997353.1 Glucose-repressible alcohol dehydrogenase transcriptional effector [Friedmanniomyces endolithicus]KAK1069617.1 Glucose-repressible alcohol dehydrogenase transcript
MADAFNRFNTGGQYFYQPQHPRTLNHRNGSPISNSRGLFQPNTDTPSPNRSPGTHSPAHNPYAMYNHSNHRQNHLLSSGAGHNFQTQMGLHKGFQNQNHGNNSHHMSSQTQDHGVVGHNSAFGNHQYSNSASNLTASTPHYAPTHLQNGNSDQSAVLGNSVSNEHWADQKAEYGRLQKAGDKPHFYARNSPHVSRFPGASQSSITRSMDTEEHGERRRALTASEEAEEAGSWDALDLGGHGLKSMGPSLFRHYPNLRKIYFNHNKLTWLPGEVGHMRNLTVLDLSFNKLDTLPAEVGMLTKLKKLLLYGNELRDLPYEIGSLYHLEVLGIAGNHMLRADYMERMREHGTKEFVRFLREQAPPPPPPNDREWIQLVDDADAEPEKFTVCSWNTLCDRAATQALYGYTPSGALTWEHRRGVILDELTHRNADILTLQEIDIENYNEYFRPNLAAEDYKGIFFPKSRAQTMAEKESKMVDGCAIFYKNTKYILLDKQLVVFSREAINRPDMKGEHDVYNRVMPRDHIAVVALLESRVTGSRLIVVNTHLAWEGHFADVKVVQVAILLEQIAKLAETYSNWPPCKDKELFKYANEDRADGLPETPIVPAPSMKYDNALQIPLLICGDFNSLADSGVHELITSGSLAPKHKDLGTQTYGDFTRHGMSHPFALKSAYASGGHWPFTNYTPDFHEVIDYAWYSTNSLQVTGLLGEVDPEYMRRVPGFPNWHFPSDHLALYVEFQVKSRKEARKAVEADFGSGSKQSSSSRH